MLKNFWFALLLHLASLNTVISNQYLKLIGLIALLILLLLVSYETIYFLLKKQQIPRILFTVFISFIILISVYIIMTLGTSINSKNLYVVIQVLLVSLFTFGVSLKTWQDNQLNNFTLITSIFIAFIFLWWLFLNRRFNGFQAYFGNPNTLAAFIWNLQFFLFAKLVHSPKNKYKYMLFIFLANFIIFISGARSLFISSIFSILVYVFWSFWVVNKRIYNLLFLLFVLFLGSFTYFYAKILPSLYELNYYAQLSKEYTGKGLLSGRQIIWSILIDRISEQPLYGYGSGTTPSDLIGITLSSHNLYLQILIQVGFLGLIAFALLMFRIWCVYRIGYRDKIVRLSASFMIGILIHQSFEVTLIQNNLAIGLLQFMVISIGLSRTIKLAILQKA
ncbi:O-antigen ligase family protein [Rivularia sp. UHCC 0363]|uniref:O-antigen ligase family protein n=1 Tax=Rivularia sp. UHCC 0363 TaxID=3110244 RepID=UPI002B1FCFD7|nr:O-antigen ligase family protein [Rivularia sp. UHCC 0363]MEA5598792.1 O-antigen ligase family protein [Rivularia sp. UHCC 0363]